MENLCYRKSQIFPLGIGTDKKTQKKWILRLDFYQSNKCTLLECADLFSPYLFLYQPLVTRCSKSTLAHVQLSSNTVKQYCTVQIKAKVAQTAVTIYLLQTCLCLESFFSPHFRTPTLDKTASRTLVLLWLRSCWTLSWMTRLYECVVLQGCTCRLKSNLSLWTNKASNLIGVFISHYCPTDPHHYLC